MKNYFKNEIHNYFSGCLHVIRKKGIVPPKEMEIFCVCTTNSIKKNISVEIAGYCRCFFLTGQLCQAMEMEID
jgi:hypothetical protein